MTFIVGIKFLKEQGCDEVQGYLFGQPLANPNFSALYPGPPRNGPHHLHLCTA